MENPLKPQPLMAEVLPGFAMIFILAVAYCSAHPGTFSAVANDKSTATVIGGGFLGLFASWVGGTFLDAVRDLSEQILDHRWPVNWGYLLSESPENIQKLEESWLAYYYLTGNMAIGLTLVAFLGSWNDAIHIPIIWFVAILGVATVFTANFLTLRNEIRQLIGKLKGMPHETTYTRIGISRATPAGSYEGAPDAGVGVIAIRPIPKGTLIFDPDDDCTIHVSAREVASLAPAIKKLYDDFCPLNNGSYLCPINFNKLTVAWYLNESETPNVIADKDLKFRALYDIKAGDELFAHYEDYSE